MSLSDLDLGPSPSPFLGLEQFINFDPYPNFKESVELYETVVFNKATCRKRQTMEKVHGLVCYEEYWHKHLLNIVDTNVKLQRPYIASNFACTGGIAQDFHQCMDLNCPIHPDKIGGTANIAKVSEELVGSEPQFLCTKLSETVDINKYPAYVSSINNYNNHINTMSAKEEPSPLSYEWLSPKSRRQYNEDNEILDKPFPPMQGLRNDIKSNITDNGDISDILQKYEFLFDPEYINRTQKTEKHITNMSTSLSNVHFRLHPVRDKYTESFSEGNCQLTTYGSDTDEPRQYWTPPRRINDQPTYLQTEHPNPQHNPYVVSFFTPLQLLSMSDFRSVYNFHPEKMVGQNENSVQCGQYEQSFGQVMSLLNKRSIVPADIGNCPSHVWNREHTDNSYGNCDIMFKPGRQQVMDSNDVFLSLSTHESYNETEPLNTSEFQQESDFERTPNSYFVNSDAMCHMSSNYNRRRSFSRSPSRSSKLSCVKQHSPDMRTSHKYSERDRDRKYRHFRVREPRVWHSESISSSKSYKSRSFSRSPDRRKMRGRLDYRESLSKERNRRNLRKSQERRNSIDTRLSGDYTKLREFRNRRQADRISYSPRAESKHRISSRRSYTRHHESEVPRRTGYRSGQRLSDEAYSSEVKGNKGTSRYRENSENYRSESNYRPGYYRRRKYTNKYN